MEKVESELQLDVGNFKQVVASNEPMYDAEFDPSDIDDIEDFKKLKKLFN